MKKRLFFIGKIFIFFSLIFVNFKMVVFSSQTPVIEGEKVVSIGKQYEYHLNHIDLTHKKVTWSIKDINENIAIEEFQDGASANVFFGENVKVKEVELIATISSDMVDTQDTESSLEQNTTTEEKTEKQPVVISYLLTVENKVNYALREGPRLFSTLLVTAADYSHITEDNHVITINDNQEYFMSDDGNPADTLIVVSGGAQPTIHLNNATLKSSTVKGAGIKVADQSTLRLILEDNTKNVCQGNNATSATPMPYAGIYVENGSTLIIDGTGSLECTGGNGYYNKRIGGCAGIGGNGGTEDQKSGTDAFGTVIINNGNITATGGKGRDDEAGAGAGIGTGSYIAAFYSEGFFPGGEVIINGGHIIANGGQGTSETSNSGGGAGIGAAGACSWGSMSATVTVTINGGTVVAKGGHDAAGIGAGSNVINGPIQILGGNITAQGGDEGDGSAYGGAGIGSGDCSLHGQITIGGSAIVTAHGAGIGAGIGSGANPQESIVHHKSGTITIKGTTKVEAYGSSTSKNGGAGIGSGGRGNRALNMVGKIIFEDSPQVKAEGGKNAYALGTGSNYQYIDGDVNEIQINTKKLELIAVSHDFAFPSCYGIENNKINENVIKGTQFFSPIWSYETTPALENTLFNTHNSLGDSQYKWEYVQNTTSSHYDYQIYKNNALVKTFDSSQQGNWLIWSSDFLEEKYTVRFYKGDQVIKTLSNINANSLIDQPDAPSQEGYQFDGWYQEKSYLNKWDFKNDKVNKNIDLYAKFIEILKAPQANIQSGTSVKKGDKIILTTASQGAKIYYTIDGTQPTSQSLLYDKPIIIDKDTTIHAMTVKEGCIDSEIKTFQYTIMQSGTVDLSIEVNGDINLIVSNKDDILKAVLTEQDWIDYKNGENVKIIIHCTEIEKDPDFQDEQYKNYQIAKSVDISIYKIIGDKERIQVTELSTPIRWILEIPSKYLPSNNIKRTFLLVRTHNQDISVLEDLDEKISTITFDSHLFSTYTILYSDEKINVDVPDIHVNESYTASKDKNSVSTNDTTNTIISLIGFTVTASCLFILRKKKK